MTQFTTSLPLINLNTANKDTLATLPGINEELAENIIIFREKTQPFEAPIEVVAVPGITEEMYRRFADVVTVESEEETHDATPPAPPAESKSPEPDSTPADKGKQEKGEDTKAHDEQPAASGEEEGEGKSPSETPAEESQSKAADLVKSQEDGYKIIWPDEDTEISTTSNEADSKPPPTPETGGFRRSWLLMVVGALLGAFISLGLLYVINDGMLVINRHPAVIELNQKLAAVEQRETSLKNEISVLREKLNEYSSLNTRLLNAESGMKVIQQAQKDMAGQLETVEQRATVVEERAATLENRTTRLETNVTTLQDETAQMQESLTELESDTNRFNQFLTGLAELLSTTAEDSQ